MLLRPVSDRRHLQCHAVLVASARQRAKEVVVRPAAVAPLRVRARQARRPLQSAEPPGRQAALAQQRVHSAVPLRRSSQLLVKQPLLASRDCFVQHHSDRLILGPQARAPDQLAPQAPVTAGLVAGALMGIRLRCSARLAMRRVLQRVLQEQPMGSVLVRGRAPALWQRWQAVSEVAGG